MALNAYLTALQQLLGTGSAGNLYDSGALTAYINRARNQVAAEGECVRSIPPISGPITAITVTSGGSGYGVAQVVINSPDFQPLSGAFPAGQQASATAVTGAAGTIVSVTLNSAGLGYFAPGVSVSDGAGTGAVLTAVVSGICQTQTGVEVYPFSQFNPMVAVSGSGISSIFQVNSITVIWGTWRRVLDRYSFSKFQVYFRNIVNYQDVPAAFCNYGQGALGSVYVGPVPNAPYQMEWDACCLPIPLATDADPEAIPPLWQDAVIYLAAYYALSSSQRFTDADRMYQQYEVWMKRARQMSQPRSVSTWYGRPL